MSENVADVKQSDNVVVYTMKPIGYIESVFKEKYGTPRQGICETTRARLRMSKHVHVGALEGLLEYSHIWISFIFHKNTNKNFRTMVSPPRLNGAKVGVLASRSPHRVNPLGMTVCRLNSINGDVLELSGIDIIDGTPVIDIKPYHPADCLPTATFPSWMNEEPPARLDVQFEPCTLLSLEEYASQAEFYNSGSELQQVIVETLEQDPRTRHSKLKHGNGSIFAIQIDTLEVAFRMELLSNSDRENEEVKQEESVVPSANLPIARVFHVTMHDSTKPRIRTSEWMEHIKAYVPL